MMPFERTYTDEQIDIVLDLYFRDHPRPAPEPAIARAIGIPDATGLEEIRWKVITGYRGREADGPRRDYTPAQGRTSRVGWPWYVREDVALRAALAGEGQRRTPPVDVAYIAAVLARTEAEVTAHWIAIREPLGRTGFGFGV